MYFIQEVQRVLGMILTKFIKAWNGKVRLSVQRLQDSKVDAGTQLR